MLVGLTDSTRILLFLASPPFWIAETHWFVVNFIPPSKIPIFVVGLISLLFWFLVGYLIDCLLKHWQRNR